MPGCYACTKNYLEDKDTHWVYLSQKEYEQLQQQKKSKGSVIHQTQCGETNYYLPMCRLCISQRMDNIRITLHHHVQNAPGLMEDTVTGAVLDYVCESICDGRLKGGQGD